MKFLFVMICISLGMQKAFAEAVPAKIATFDMARAIQSVGEGKKARETLQKEADAKQQKIASEGKKIQEAVEALRKQAAVLDEKSRQEKESSIQQQVMKLRELEAKSQTEFQNRDREISMPIVKKLRDLVTKTSKEKGYTLVLNGDESMIIVGSPTDDLTDEVIKLYDGKKK